MKKNNGVWIAELTMKDGSVMDHSDRETFKASVRTDLDGSIWIEGIGQDSTFLIIRSPKITFRGINSDLSVVGWQVHRDNMAQASFQEVLLTKD